MLVFYPQKNISQYKPMQEAITATVLFWSIFAFSAGPFWIATMEAAKHSTFGYLYKNYVLYLLLGWLPIITVIGLVVSLVGAISPMVSTVLYFVGAAVIVYLAWRVIAASQGKVAQLDFNWKVMTLVSWTNPKIWLTIPPGFLAATYTESMWLNIAIFYLLGLPLFLFGVYFWGMIGRQGAKIAKHKMSYFNAALLISFALYLLYQGIQLL